MKKYLKGHLRLSLAALACAFLACAVLWACTSDPNANRSSLSSNPGNEQPDLNKTSSDAIAALTGNGAPNGAHYNLNLIGVPKDKSADMTGNNGHRIFVKLGGKTQILLSPGDFSVLDANGTDGSASFQLPNPDPDNDGVTTYSVWARALGKPGGKALMTTCAIDPVTLEEVCSLATLELVRKKGQSTFSDVSRYLLYIYADVNGDGVVDRVPLFDNRLQGYFWDYDNQGLKLVQLRFYEVPSNVN
ncbi:MAG: hypothetical protein ACREBU_18895 [Nitrososphaera sp.]